MWKEKVWTMNERLAEEGRVQAYEFSVEGTDCHVKFASPKQVKTPVHGDRALGYTVDSSDLTGSVRVSILEPSCNESILTTHVKGL